MASGAHRFLPIVVLLCGLGRIAVAAPDERLAVVPLERGAGVIVSAADLEAAVLRGLAVAGRTVVPAPASTCATPACWTRLGAQLNVAYLVGGRVLRRDGAFHVSFKLIRATDGVSVATEENSCDAADCSVAELARRSARELVRQTLGRKPNEAQSPPPAVQAPPVPVIAPAPPIADVAKTETPRHPWWPLVAMGAGGATLGAGVVLLTMNNNCANAACSRLYDTLAPGLVVMTAGTLVAIAGTVFLLREERMRVGIGPRSLFLAGRF